MRYKSAVIQKIEQLRNLVNGQEALLTTAKSLQEVKDQLERIRVKIEEINVLVKNEEERF